MIPVVVFALSVTVLVIVASVRGNLFQSSLLSNDGVTVGSGSLFSAPSLVHAGSGVDLKEFPIYSERTQVYRTALLGENNNNNIGFYFPNIYRIDKAGQGLINIAFKPGTDVMVQKSLRLTLSYPGKVMKYVGEPIVSSSGATITVDAVSQPNQMTIELMPTEGVVWDFNSEVNPFISLPMEVMNTDTLLPNTGLQLRIERAEHVAFDNTVTTWPYALAPVDILYYSPTSTGTTRPMPTSEVRMPTERGVLTIENKPAPEQPATEGVQSASTTTTTPVTTTNSAGVQAFRMPLLTQDQTRISPPLIREKSRETVFVYLSVTDPDGQSDIKAVEMNLSSFGLASRVPLVQVSTGPKYSVYGASFVLPDSVVASNTPYEIPYMVTDGGSNVLQGTLKFTVHPASGNAPTTASGITPAPATTGTAGTSLLGQPSSTMMTGNAGSSSTTTDRPEGLNIETDLNGDGKVDEKDLSIYLFTYNLDHN